MKRLVLLFFCLLLATLVHADPTPEATARRLYTWLQKAGDQSSKHLDQVQDALTPELYQQLTAAYARDPNSGEFLDFDPWSFTQMGASGYVVGNARMVGGQAKIPVTVKVLGGGRSTYTCILTSDGGDWRVANLVYTPEFNLLSALRDINK